MVRKILLTFLISLAIMPVSNASVQLTVEQADQILDYFSENVGYYAGGTSDTDLNTTKSYLRNANRENFTNFFNTNISTVITTTEDYDWSNIIIVCSSEDSSHYANLDFIISNCSASSYWDYLCVNGNSTKTTFSVFKPDTEEFTGVIGRYRVRIKGSTSFQKSGNLTTTSIYYNHYAGSALVDDGIKLTINSVLGCAPSQVVYYNNGTEITSRFLTNYIKLTPDIDIPDEPSSGDTSGDTGGGGSTTTPDYTQDLDDIKNEIGETNNKLDNIQNTINGETQKVIGTLTDVPDLSDKNISSGDIENSLDFEFMEDPYSNFWLELTTGLSGALTDNIRTLEINWLGHIHTIDLDKIGLKYPPSMELILKSTSTVAIVWVLVKWWKIIVDKLSSGNMDEVLAMNEEERNY